jgi:DnaJ-class molecular chaperone
MLCLFFSNLLLSQYSTNPPSQRALELHPDKHMDKDEETRKKTEHEFKLLGEALEILTNEMAKDLYDKGYDADAIRERVQAAQRAANERPQQRGRHY